MDNVFVVAGIISFIYLIAKFMEMRFFEKESKPLKLLVRDTLLVYFSVLIGIFILDQFKGVISDEAGKAATIAFTGEPEF